MSRAGKIVRGAPTEITPLVEYGVLGWMAYQGSGLPTHLVPTWDIQGHALGPPCACTCGPRWDETIECFVHIAFDGREKYETGQARRH